MSVLPSIFQKQHLTQLIAETCISARRGVTNGNCPALLKYFTLVANSRSDRNSSLFIPFNKVLRRVYS